MDIQPISYSLCVNVVDLEELQIMRKLKAYGVTPTGKKSIDKEMLRRIELQKAKESTIVENKFLTVSKGEQEKIQQKKKERKAAANPDISQNSMKGAKTLGEQLFLATQMKKKKIEKQNETKKNQ